MEPAIFISADADETDPRTDDYLVWQILFNQTVTFGMDPFATDNLPLQRAAGRGTGDRATACG